MVAEHGPRYADPEYQAAHDATFSNPLTKEIPSVLPPGVSSKEFETALSQLAEALGEDSVYKGEKLKDYVDPYEIPEGGHERNIPGAAVW